MITDDHLPTSDQLARLMARLARVEAAEQVRSGITAYAAAVDSHRFEDLMNLFCEDAEFVACNFPSGSGTTLRRTGRAAIAPITRILPDTEVRHHVTNIAIDVDPDAMHADVSAYYLHTHVGGISGGVYEGRWRVDPDGVWRIERWQITAGWGLPIDSPGYAYAQGLDAQTLRAGHPVQWSHR